jgi:hypothetical protein
MGRLPLLSLLAVVMMMALTGANALAYPMIFTSLWFYSTPQCAPLFNFYQLASDIQLSFVPDQCYDGMRVRAFLSLYVDLMFSDFAGMLPVVDANQRRAALEPNCLVE